MTDLTEQWKKGKLPSGWYYVKGSRVEGIYAFTAEYLNNMYRPENGERIIEQVPSYEEWQASEKYNKHLEEVIKVYERKDKQATETSIAYNELAEENAQLKERVSKLEKMQYSYTPEEWNTMLRTVNRTKELLKKCFEYIDWTDGTGSPISQQKLLDEINEALR